MYTAYREQRQRRYNRIYENMTEYIDLIVPRGGRGLIDTLVNNSKVPFILDGDGNVHLYIHKDAKDCLLYTSPSPRDLRLSRMPSSA